MSTTVTERAFLQRGLSHLFVQELLWYATTVTNGCEYLFSTFPVVPAPQGLLVNEPAIGRALEEVAAAAANMRRLISGPPKKMKGESSGAYAVRQERYRAMSALLSGVELEEIEHVTVRNQLEHFDEYLDDAIAVRRTGDELPGKALSHSQDGHQFAAYNIGVSDWAVFSAIGIHNVWPLRLYVASERKLYHLQDVLNVEKLHRAARDVRARITASGLIVSDGLYGGGMMIHVSSPAIQRQTESPHG